MNQPFERVVEWTDKDLLKDSLLPPPCGETMKLHWLTARLEHAGEISTEKYLVSQIQGSEITVYIYIYIYIYKLVI